VNPGHAARLAKLFEKAGGFHVDGESVGDTLFIFDLLQAGATEEEGDIRFLGYMDRMKRLERIAALRPEAFAEDASLPGQIVIVETWEGREAKRAAFAALKARNAEGVVFKRRDAEFKAGRPSAGGDHLKFKFYATASFIVKGVNAKRSIALALLDEMGATVGMGNCTVPPNYDLPAVGEVVEVRYLYAFPSGGKVYQPTYLGKRDDVLQDECLMTQIKFKAGTEEDD
jgi:bifunctional non-homologous end joining protein LigD